MTDYSAIVYVLVFASGFFCLRAILDFGKDVSDKSLVNDRLKVQARTNTVSEAVVELRRKRGLDEDGNRKLTSERIGALVAKSGLAFKPWSWASGTIAIAAFVGVVLFFLTGNLWLSAGACLGVLPLLPYLVLTICAGRREKKLGAQLPDGLEIIVRSLQAGHPVPTSVSLVGREMPDPLGSEFGMVSDEIAYGSSLEEAIQKLAVRTEHPDIGLFAATVRLQARTGGNLAELLATIARTVRQRQKMRLKIKAASSEGRMSAMILTAAPVVMLVAMHLMTPHFYGQVIDEPIIRWGLGITFVWMLIGNYIMRQMIRFKV